MDVNMLFEEACKRDWKTTTAGEVPPVRFAVIGLGWFTKGRALPALEESARCEPTVLVSNTAEKAKRVARDVDGAVRGISYNGFHDGAAREEYDAVYVCTPNALHHKYVETASSFGKDVFCEKPMERDSDRARDLVATCADAGVELMIAYRMHTEPAVRRARELIREGPDARPRTTTPRARSTPGDRPTRRRASHRSP